MDSDGLRLAAWGINDAPYAPVTSIRLYKCLLFRLTGRLLEVGLQACGSFQWMRRIVRDEPHPPTTF
jgi:hypothetical protein